MGRPQEMMRAKENRVKAIEWWANLDSTVRETLLAATTTRESFVAL